MRKFIKLTEWFSRNSVFLAVDHIISVSVPIDDPGAKVVTDMPYASYSVKESPEEIVKLIEEVQS